MGIRFRKNRVFLSTQKCVAALLLLVLVFSDLARLPYVGEFLSWFSVEKVLAIAGDFSVYREQTGGDVVDSGTTPLAVTWDTIETEGTGIELLSGSSTVDLSEAGKYLVLYNVWTDEGTGGVERRSFETYLTLDGVEIPYGRGDGYIRDSGGDNHAYAAGAALIEADAGDDLEVVINRDDTNAETAGIRSGTNGLSVLRMKDDFDYLRIKKTTDVTDISGNTTFTDVVWDTNDEVDTGSFDFIDDSADITLKGSDGDHFLVTTNVGIYQTANSNTRQNYELRLTLDGKEVPGSRVTAYPRGNPNSDGIYQGSLVYSGIIQKTSASDQTLNIEVRRESQGSATTRITAADTALAIAALPSTAHYISLTSTSSAQTYTNVASAFNWNEQIEVDTTAFSHSTTTNNSRLNIDLDGDYLFFSTAYTSRSTSGTRNVPVIEWRLDGGTIEPYGGHGSFNRGDQSTTDAYTSGSSGGIILPGLTDTQYLEVTKRDEAVATPNAQFPAGYISVQGVELSLLFQTNVDVSATSSHIATTSVPVTDEYQGGGFVITENTGSRFISSIQLTETGTIDGSTGLENIKLYYDLDTTAPYDCTGESYQGTESQFGATDTNGFSGPDGTVSFSGSASISTTQAFCGYVVYDVTDAASDGDTIQIVIDDPTTDVTVTGGGTISPNTTQAPTGSTVVENAELTQTHFRWLEDDGVEGGATAVDAEDVSVGGFANGTVRRLRLQVDAAGSVDSLPTTFQLDYATKTASCAAVTNWIDVGAANGAWDMSNSPNITDGNDATNISGANGGVTDPGGASFLTTNGGLRDTSSQTGSLTLISNQFVEFEFAIEPTTQAVEGTTYCFRVSDSGTALRSYDVYPEGTVSADVTVSVTGSHISSVDVGSTTVYIGGQFAFARSGASQNLTSITFTETGSVDATNLTNPRLYYDFDTTNPYDCASESFALTDGSVAGTAFSGPNGTTTFTGTAPIGGTQTLCGYLVFDVDAATANAETIELQITDPSVDVLVNSSTIGPSTVVSPAGSTTIAGPILTQTGYHWRNDNGTEAGASSATGGSENTPLTKVARHVTERLRYQVSNEGTVTSAAAQYRLEYGTKVTTCADVGTWQDVDGGVAFTMGTTSQLVDGNDTTDVLVANGGVTNPGGKTFLTPNGAQKEDDSQTGNITLTSSQFVELEYAIEATDQAGYDTTYCFRLSDAGTALPSYIEYAELTTREKQDFFIQRGTETVSGTGTTLVAGIDYTAPAGTSSAFVRISSSQITGSGNTTGGVNQNADDVTVHIGYPTDITQSFSIVRPSTAASETRVDWEIIEYTGLSAADNEMIVRDVGTVTYGSAAFSVTGAAVNGVADDSDIVVFITGQSNDSTVTTNYNPGQSTSDWNDSLDRPVLTRGDNGDTGTVSYAVVEFTGINWKTQRVEHNYTAAAKTETESITAVNSPARAFVHAQKRHGNSENGLDAYGHQVWLSSIGAVSFQLNAGAGTPSDHNSVAWVIENTQTGDGAMAVYRDADSVDADQAVEPRTSVFSFNGTVNSISNASIFITNDSTGDGTAYPRPMLGATVTSTTQFELFESDAGQTQVFKVAVVEWPVAQLAFQQNYYRFYVDNDTLTPTDPWPVGGTDLGENTSITGADDPLGESERTRVRMTLQVSNATFPEFTKSFKLQYGRRDGASCAAIATWDDVGAPGSGEIWRGYSATPADGATLPSTLISVADEVATYEESNNSAVNPNSAEPGENVEYDWIIEHNGATQRTDYCFRMVESDGTELTAYNNYPTLKTTGYTPVIGNWRWYGDETNVTPSTALASENVAPTDVAQGDVIKLRVSSKEVENAAGSNVKFSLQYSEYSDFSQEVYTLTATTSCVASSTWCYADGGGIDNAIIPSAVLTNSDSCVAGVGDGCGTHNESIALGSPHTQPASSEMEFEFTLQHAAARANAVYYFRLYDVTNDDPLVASTSYPSLVTEGPQLVLSVSGVNAGTSVAGIVTDATSTPTTIDFGSLPFNTDQEVAQRVSVDTNATQGYQVFKYADQQLLNTYGTEITPITGTNATPLGWGTACSGAADSCFGYHTTDATLEGGSGRFAPTDSYAALSTSLSEVMYSSVPADDQHDLIYRINVSELQPAGDYQTNITYVAVPVF